MMTKYTPAALLALSGLASAAPLDARSTPAVCLAVDAVVDILRLYPSASPFCSSFLAIPTITTTKTVSTTASFTSPTTTTIPTTVATTTIIADVVTLYSTSVTAITTCIPSAVNKRDNLARAATATKSGVCSASPSVLKGIACSAVSTACGCLGIPTPTSTVTLIQTSSTTAFPTVTVYSSVTSTTTTTPTTTLPYVSTSTINYCPTPVSCNNNGIRWAKYPNGLTNPDNYYTGYDPTVIKTETPDYQATASVCGGLYESDVGDITIYGSTETFVSDYFTLNHVGYIFAQQSGTYTFTLTNADDIALLWLGQTAISGWNRDNTNTVAIVHSTPTASTTYTLTEGQYLPFRIVFGQAQGTVSFTFTLQAPDGTVILDSNTQNSPLVVQYSCDGTTAPAFPAFGSES